MARWRSTRSTTLGPKVERHPAFPARVNFGVGRMLGRDRMELRVWERGVGETLACGSGGGTGGDGGGGAEGAGRGES